MDHREEGACLVEWGGSMCSREEHATPFSKCSLAYHFQLEVDRIDDRGRLGDLKARGIRECARVAYGAIQ